jgi:hypothetical protein
MSTPIEANDHQGFQVIKESKSGRVHEPRNNMGIKCRKLREEKVRVIYTVFKFHLPLLKLFFAMALNVSRA